MARPQLPRSTDAQIESATPGVPSADPKKQIALVPVHVRGSFVFDYDGIGDKRLFPSPFDRNWADGWVPRATRNQLRNHPKVYQGVNNLKNGILGDGGRWIPCFNPYLVSKEKFALARKYYDFLEYCYRHMHGSNYVAMRQLLDCIEEGNKLAPISLRVETSGSYKGKWVLDRLRVWPNDVYVFGKDEFGHTVSVKVLTGSINDQTEFPIEKFLHLCWRPINDDPYGTTVHAPIYESVLEDWQAKFENSAYMSTWGRPSVVIFAAPVPEGMVEEKLKLFTRDKQPIMVTNPDYDPSDPESPETIQAEGYITEQNGILFTDFESGSIWSLQGGSKVEVKQAQSGGADVFKETRQEAGGRIMDVIYGTRNVTENTSTSQGGADLNEGVAGLNVTEGKVILEQMDENQLGRLLIELNFGEAALEYLPIRDWGSGQNGRLPKIMNAQVGFASNKTMTQAQYWDFCAANGLPLPWPEDEPASKASSGSGTGGGDKTGSSDNNGKPPVARGSGE